MQTVVVQYDPNFIKDINMFYMHREVSGRKYTTMLTTELAGSGHTGVSFPLCCYGGALFYSWRIHIKWISLVNLNDAHD